MSGSGFAILGFEPAGLCKFELLELVGLLNFAIKRCGVCSSRLGLPKKHTGFGAIQAQAFSLCSASLYQARAHGLGPRPVPALG